MKRRSFVAGLSTAAATIGVAAVQGIGLTGLSSATANAAGPELKADASAPARLKLGGLPIRLRGLAVGEVMDARAWRPTSDYGVIARDWKSNVARLSVFPALYRDRRATLLRYLDRDVKAALANGLVVIITWHTIGWPDGWTEDPIADPTWSLCVNFWTRMRDLYGANGRIAFELWNEPMSPTGWGESNARVWPELRRRYIQLVSIIRQKSQNLILCAGDWNSYDLRGIRANPVPGSNIGYVWHCYAGNSRDEDPAEWAMHLDGLDQVAPVVVTEWGFSPAAADPNKHYYGSADSFGRKFVSFMNSRSLNHTAWCWHPEWGPAMLQQDWRTPTAFGRFVKNTLSAP
jgi:hypothetical protein